MNLNLKSKKGFTDIMLAILIGILLVFGALVFFASEINSMTRSINLILREYEISMAENEYYAMKRSLQTATLLGGVESIFVNGIKGVNGYGDGKPYIWYINHTPPVGYLFAGLPKEYRYNPTKKDLSDRLHHYSQEYFDELNTEITNQYGDNVKPMKLPGIETLEYKIQGFESGDIYLSTAPKYGILKFDKINYISMPGAICTDKQPPKRKNYMKIVGSDIYYCKKDLYIPKCYVFGGECKPIQGMNIGDDIKKALDCEDETCGCPSDQYCDGYKKCSTIFDCPLNTSRKILMTSGFGCRRLKPSKPVEFHPGVDLVYNPEPSIKDRVVYSTGDGIWYAAYDESNSGGYGNMIVLAHGCINDSDPANLKRRVYFSIYGHLYSFDPESLLNFKVNKGETIGYIGSSGMSTGAHLHFEFRNSTKDNVDNDIISKPPARTNLINPCELMNENICGSCDCKSECCMQNNNWCNINDCNKCNGCKVYTDSEKCN